MSNEGYFLIFASRLLEVFGFLMTVLFIFKGIALVAQEGKDPYYFDEEGHLKRFLEDLSEYKRLRKPNIKSIEDVFVKGWRVRRGQKPTSLS